MLATLLTLFLAQEGEIRLIVQGDDMGAAHAINLGTIRAYRDGIMRTTNFMVPTPWMPEAVQLLAQNPGLDVGIHLTLTSEWSLVKWRPLTIAPSLTGRDGNFYPMVRPNKVLGPGQSMQEAGPVLAEVERELRAQIEAGKRLVPRVSYMSTHMGFGSAFPEIQELLGRLSKEYGLPIPGPATGVQRLPPPWQKSDDSPTRAAKLARALENLGPGTWLTVDHAALDGDEMRGIHHPGYEDVARDRQGVVDAWTAQAVKDVVKRRGIKLVGHAPAPR